MSAASHPMDRVRDVISGLWPARFGPDAFTDDTPAGTGGAGLDSVEMAELLLTCEEVSGVPMPESLLTESTLTIRGIAETFWGGAE